MASNIYNLPSEAVHKPGLVENIKTTWNKAPTWKKVALVATIVIGALVAGLILASPVGLGLIGVGLPLFIAAGVVGGLVLGLDVAVLVKSYQYNLSSKAKELWSLSKGNQKRIFLRNSYVDPEWEKQQKANKAMFDVDPNLVSSSDEE